MAFPVKKMDNLVRYDFRHDRIIKGVGLDTDKNPIMSKTGGRILQYHALMYIVKGCGHFEDQVTRRRKVIPGTLFYLYPRRWHNFDPDPGTVWTEYWVLFDGAKANKTFGSIIPPAEKSFYQVGLDQEFVALYEELYDIWFYQGNGFREYSLLLLHEILAKAWLRISGFNFRRKHDWLHRVRTHMKNNLSVPECDLHEFMVSENIGREAFRKRFRRVTGFAPKQYFLLLKMNRAKEMLLRQGESIKNIAASLGFDDQYYFSRLFRKKEGVSPKGYRRWISTRSTPAPQHKKS